jgi:hypothetical protein
MIIVPTVRGFIKASAPKPPTPVLTFDTPPVLTVASPGPFTVYTPAHVSGGPFWVEWAGNLGNGVITAGGLSTDKVHNVSGMTVTTGMVLYGFGTLTRPAAGATYQIGFNMKTVQGGTLIGATNFIITTVTPNE